MPAPKPEPKAPLRVGYILKMFPRLSETFILNELLELEAQGVELSVFSLMYPQDGKFHGRLADLRVEAQYFPQEKPEFYWDMIRAADDGLTPPFERWEEAADFMRCWGIPKDLALLVRAVAIARRVRERGIQHLHAHFATIATQVAALVNILTGVSFSFTAHAKDIFRETVNGELYADLVRRAQFNITVSDFNRDFILERMPGVDSDKVVRLYNGIDLRFFSAAPRPPAAEALRLLSVGRLVPKKGFDVLLDAVHLLTREGKPIRLTIVGDGEDRESLLRQRTSLGLDGVVHFTGALTQEEVRRLCKEHDAVVLACLADDIGNRDALPTTLLEALASDRPIVSTRLTGIPEIVGTEAGVLAEPGDAAAFARAVDELGRRLRAGQFPVGVARQRAERWFDLERNVAVLRERFEQCANQVDH
ncbi:MAG: glycosyltransferase [Planctomycetota bacterium]